MSDREQPAPEVDVDAAGAVADYLEYGGTAYARSCSRALSPRRLAARSLGASHAVVSVKTEKAVETFVRREDAERFLEEVRADDAELADRLRVEPVELDASPSPGSRKT